jgi:hypothetical protein
LFIFPLLLIITTVVLIVFLFHKIPYIKGAIGESLVNRQLSKLPKDKFKILNNIFINTLKGSSEIDHIVISVYGIFVIETKYYKGWIHGNENSEYWKQTIYQWKNKFRNPIKQNWAHIYAVKDILSDYRNIKYFPIIVFAGSAELKNVYSNIPVIYDNELYNVILESCIEINLTQEQVNEISDKLNENIIKDKNAKKSHIKQVNYNKYNRLYKIQSGICPRCSGNMILRNSQYGEFYGCSNYPKCKYKRNTNI